MCSSSNKFESRTIGFNLLVVSHLLAEKHPEKNVVMDNNPWEQREISYLVNEVKLQYLHHHELNHWDLVGRNGLDTFTETKKFRENSFQWKDSENWTVAMEIQKGTIVSYCSGI